MNQRHRLGCEQAAIAQAARRRQGQPADDHRGQRQRQNGKGLHRAVLRHEGEVHRQSGKRSQGKGQRPVADGEGFLHHRLERQKAQDDEEQRNAPRPFQCLDGCTQLGKAQAAGRRRCYCDEQHGQELARQHAEGRDAHHE